MLPEPDCTDDAYSFDLLAETLGEEKFAELMDWMHGQTMRLCDDHGPVVYAWDVASFLREGVE